MDMKLIEHQIELEKLHDKNQTVQRIMAEFEAVPEFEPFMLEKGIDPRFGFSMLTQMALHKRAELPVLVGLLRGHWKGDERASQFCVNELLKCAEADLVDWDPVKRQFIVVFTLSQDVQDEIDRFQYPLPMVIPPRHVSDNNQTGYMVMSKGQIILRTKGRVDDHDVCLDHINRVNRIRFTVNDDVATMVRNEWRNLDKPKADETHEEFMKRVKAFEKYDRTAKDVMATVMAVTDVVHLTHKYDKRGRFYCQGYHVNYQGTCWNKAVLELADEEIIP